MMCFNLFFGQNKTNEKKNLRGQDDNVSSQCLFYRRCPLILSSPTIHNLTLNFCEHTHTNELKFEKLKLNKYILINNNNLHYSFHQYKMVMVGRCKHKSYTNPVQDEVWGGSRDHFHHRVLWRKPCNPRLQEWHQDLYMLPCAEYNIQPGRVVILCAILQR